LRIESISFWLAADFATALEAEIGLTEGARYPIMTPTSGSSSVGRASAFQADGRGFESRLPLHETKHQEALDAMSEPGLSAVLGELTATLTAKLLLLTVASRNVSIDYAPRSSAIDALPGGWVLL
jgi:hypothetical protein